MNVVWLVRPQDSNQGQAGYEIYTITCRTRFLRDMSKAGNKVVKSQTIENTAFYVSRAVFILPYGDRHKGKITSVLLIRMIISSPYNATDV